GCKNSKFLGVYTAVDPFSDVFNNGTVIHKYVYQLNLQSNGTANQYWTGVLDYPINTGSASPETGSWKCREDGILVVTLLRGIYLPTGPTANTALPDIQLGAYVRTTYMFSVEDDNTLTRIALRNRTYTVIQDPTDPNGGTLHELNTTALSYKRLIASDA